MSVRKIVLTLLGIAMVCSSVWMMTGILSTITLCQVVDAVHRTPATRLLACGLATAISFAGLAYYDRFATRLVVPDAVPAHRAWVVGAASHALSNTLGFHAVTGGALRYHFYRQEQVRAVDIAKITMVVGACVALGPLSLLAIVFSTAARPTFAAVRVVGIAVLGLLACAVYLSPGIARRFRSQPEASSALKRTDLIAPLGRKFGRSQRCAVCALSPSARRSGTGSGRFCNDRAERHSAGRAQPFARRRWRIRSDGTQCMSCRSPWRCPRCAAALSSDLQPDAFLRGDRRVDLATAPSFASVLTVCWTRPGWAYPVSPQFDGG